MSRTLGDQCFRMAGHLQAKTDILRHRHMRIERIGLENHGDTALGRADIGHVLAADRQPAFGNSFQAGNHPQKRGLAAAGRADKNTELAIGNIEIDALDDIDGAKAFLDGAQADVAHRVCLLL